MPFLHICLKSKVCVPPKFKLDKVRWQNITLCEQEYLQTLDTLQSWYFLFYNSHKCWSFCVLLYLISQLENMCCQHYTNAPRLSSNKSLKSSRTDIEVKLFFDTLLQKMLWWISWIELNVIYKYPIHLYYLFRKYDPAY